MKYAVLWSGGLDSTFLIWDLLKQGHTVHASYVELINNGAKVKYELNAINKMKALFKSKFPNTFNYSGVALRIDIRTKIAGPMPQILYWLISIPGILQQMNELYPDEKPSIYKDNAEDHSSCWTAAMGYIVGDQECSYMDDMRKLMKSMQIFTFKDIEDCISFPICKWNKTNILISMERDDFAKYLIGLIWTCEFPIESNQPDLFDISNEKMEPCWKCEKCKELEEALQKVGINKNAAWLKEEYPGIKQIEDSEKQAISPNQIKFTTV